MFRWLFRSAVHLILILTGSCAIVSPVIKIMQLDIAEASENGSKQAGSSTEVLGTKQTYFVAEWKDASEQSDQPVLALKFSSNGKLVVTSDGGGILRLWDVEHGKLIRKLLGHEGEVRAVCFSPDGTRIVSGGIDGTVRLWEVESGKTLWSVEGHKLEDPELQDLKVMVHAVDFSPDGKSVVSGGLDGTMRIWDATDGRQIGLPMKQEAFVFVLSLAVSPDGTLLLSGDGVPDPEAGFSIGKLRLWDVKSRKEIWSVVASDHGVSFVCIRGSQALTAGGDGLIKLWELATGKELRIFKGHKQPVTTAVFSPDGMVVLSAGIFENVRLWDAVTGYEIDQVSLPVDVPSTVAFAPDGRTFLVGTETGRIFVFEILQGSEMFSASNSGNPGSPK